MSRAQHSSSRRGALVTAIAIVIVVGATSLPWVAALPTRDGYYTLDSPWHVSPMEEFDDGTHTAYTGSTNPITWFNGLTVSIVTPSGIVGQHEWITFHDFEYELTVSGITGVRVEYPLQGYNGPVRIICDQPDHPTLPSCSVPGGEYSMVLSWRTTARSGECYQEWQELDWPKDSFEDHCPRVAHSGTSVRRVAPGAPWSNSTPTTSDPQEPFAMFSFEISDTEPREVTFENRTADPDDDFEDLTFLWDFGDDSPTSDEVHPTHTYERAGTYTVRLVATDPDGRSDDYEATIEVGNLGLIVNSTADDPAEDPTVGCDTGDTVDDEPECTLRAAIESANAAGGGEITFDIDTDGVPTIAVTTPLPALTDGVSIDGTSQDGGLVALKGPGNVESTRGIELSTGTSTVTGLVISSFQAGIHVTGGSGHLVEGNLLGVDATGSSATTLLHGVVIEHGDAVVVRDNHIGATFGVFAVVDATAPVVEGNTIGATTSGATLGATEIGVVTGNPSTEVTDNTIHASLAGVLVVGARATGATVTGNTVRAVPRDGGSDDGAYAIRIDGAPGASVSGNTVTAAPGHAGIAVTGSVQAWLEDGIISLGGPNVVGDDPVTGGDVSIGGNTITGQMGEGGNPTGLGVQSWADASRIAVGSNTITTVATGIVLEGGEGHRIVDNSLDRGDVRVGIEVRGVSDTVIGEAAGPNEIEVTGAGIRVRGTSRDVTITGNTVTGGDDGIDVGAGADGVSVADNVVRRSGDALTLGGDGVIATGNVLSENVRAIVSSGESVEIEGNRIGLAATGSEVLGNSGDGVTVTGGDALVIGNTIAGSALDGVKVIGGEATLRGNRIYDTGGTPILTATGPAAPGLLAAIRTGSGDGTRTTLVLTDLPGTAGGTLEVFADESCDPAEGGGQARYLMNLTRTTEAGETARIIQIQGNASRRFFTLTYTDPETGTSALSHCVEAGTYPDDDGDGSPDPLDHLYGSADDPSQAVIATDSEELLVLTAMSADLPDGEGGQAPPSVPLALSEVAIVDDPAPHSHPAGFHLPYGVLQFRVTLAQPGGRAAVVLSTLTADQLPAGATYWKHGSPSPGAPAQWFEFGYDEQTGTGATTQVLGGGSGFDRAFVLYFVDGQRGDSDGGANGTITDPGAVALVGPGGGSPGQGPGGTPGAGGSDPDTDPDTDSDEVSPPADTGTGRPSTPASDDGGVAVGAHQAVPDTSAGGARGLPRTGTAVGSALFLAAVLLLAGAGSVHAGSRSGRRLVEVGDEAGEEVGELPTVGC